MRWPCCCCCCSDRYSSPKRLPIEGRSMKVASFAAAAAESGNEGYTAEVGTVLQRNSVGTYPPDLWPDGLHVDQSELL